MDTLFAVIATLSIFNAAEAPAKEAAADAPAIKFEEMAHDFGTITQYSSNDFTFKFQNVGTQTLNIENVQSSCGCTAALVTEKAVAPAKSGEIKITFKSGEFSGKVSKNVTVTTNDPANQTVRLEIKADVITDMLCTPVHLNFGEITADANRELSVKLSSPTGKKFKVLGAKPSLTFITTEVVEPAQDQGEYTIRVKIQGMPPSGGFTGIIALQTDFDKPAPSITVSGHVASRTEVIPPKLFFGVINGNAPPREITVKANLWDQLKIESVDVPASLAAEAREVTPGKEWRISVSIKQPVPEGMLKDKITIHLNDADMKIVEVPVSALVRKPE